MIETEEKFRIVQCANCGKDVEVGERPDEKCYWCHKPALKKEDVTMVARINARDLKPETIQKFGIAEEIKTAGLPPVPPRPDVSGKILRERLQALKKYYEEYAAAILADRAKLGDKETRNRWGFSETGYKHFLQRRALSSEAGGKYRRRQKKIAAPSAIKTPASPSSPPAPKAPPAGEPAKDVQPHFLKFPDFDELGQYPSNEIRIAWMNNYIELYRIDHPAFSVQVTTNPAVASPDVQIQKLNWIRRISKRLWE